MLPSYNCVTAHPSRTSWGGSMIVMSRRTSTHVYGGDGGRPIINKTPPTQWQVVGGCEQIRIWGIAGGEIFELIPSWYRGWSFVMVHREGFKQSTCIHIVRTDREGRESFRYWYMCVNSDDRRDKYVRLEKVISNLTNWINIYIESERVDLLYG